MAEEKASEIARKVAELSRELKGASPLRSARIATELEKLVKELDAKKA